MRLLSTLVLVVFGALIPFWSASSEEVEFRHSPEGRPAAVFLAGDFNNWNPSGHALADGDGDGVWTVVIDLPAGRYEYKFVVDGRWIEDVNADQFQDDPFGGRNSVRVVGGSAEKGRFVGTDQGANAAAGAPKNGGTAGEVTPGGGKSVPAGDVVFTWAPEADYDQVFLAGEFNEWSATALAMTKDGDQWTASVPLAAGRYEYKFVAGGIWHPDPNAAEFVENPYGEKNSVIVVGGGSGAKAATPEVEDAGFVGTGIVFEPGDVTFSWTPETEYDQVFLAGSFNDWNASALAMTKVGDSWTATVPLSVGRHEYKFVAGGVWHPDPSASDYVDNPYGEKNSIVIVGEGGVAPAAPSAPTTPAAPTAPAVSGDPEEVTFSYQPLISGIGTCSVAGSFNDWNATEFPMSDEDGDGTWTTTVTLPPGEYEYRFVIDQNTWLEDPNSEEFAENPFGGKNSLIRVGMPKRAATGPGKPRHVSFEYTPAEPASSVSLAGTFNNWAAGKHPMTDDDGDGTFTTTMLLPEGDYHYKFVVDGVWYADETAAWFVDDGFGAQNSGLTVDSSFEGIELELGDGKVYADGIEHRQSIREVNPLSDTEVEFTARAYANDVESVSVLVRAGADEWTLPMSKIGFDATFEYYRSTLRLGGAGQPPTGTPLEYGIVYADGGETRILGQAGLGAAEDAQLFVFSEETITRFSTPDWVRDGVFYQIFPERFANGDPSNDPDFSEEYYQGRTTLPASGKTNGEYYHLVEDWYDVAGLSKSPYRTDGKPDYSSFYGGDIAGILQHLDYLEDLGVTILYFNPLFPARSNHKYEAYDYQAVDPHFGTPEEFRAFVDECHSRGIRIVPDWVINHIGDHSPYFQDTVRKGKDSEYWNWFEWNKWPLPATEPTDWREYYECWWGFAHMPDLNFDLSRINSQENGVANADDAEINWPVVNYILDAAEWWLVDMDVDGFRLDVPNEVPFWVWKMFRERVRSVKPDAYLVGEIWSDAGDWVSPDCFDATMNYKYFKDPVSSFLGQGRMDAARFDREMQAGRMAYPMQAVRVMMNLVGSHDTPRYLNAINGNLARQKLTALFQMTYVGAPHIYYGDEIATRGGADPDCRRPFDWRWESNAERSDMHGWYRGLIHLRRNNPTLITGEYATLRAEGSVHAFARVDENAAFVVVTNAGDHAVDVEIPVGDLGSAFRNALDSGAQEIRAENGSVKLHLEPVTGLVLARVP